MRVPPATRKKWKAAKQLRKSADVIVDQVGYSTTYEGPYLDPDAPRGVRGDFDHMKNYSKGLLITAEKMRVEAKRLEECC